MAGKQQHAEARSGRARGQQEQLTHTRMYAYMRARMCSGTATGNRIEVGEEGNRRRSSPWSSWTRLGSAGVAGYVEPDDEMRRPWRRRPAMPSVRRGPTQFKARRRSSGRRGSSWASSRTPGRLVGATTTATMASTVRAMTILTRASGRGGNEG